MAGFNSTTLAETVAASGIARYAIPTPVAQPLFAVLAMQWDLTSNGSNVFDIPSWDAFPATEETTEGAEVAQVNYATSKKTMTGVMISTRSHVTDQIVQDSTLPKSEMVNQMVRNVRNTVDVETLELFKTASNMSDNTGVNLTVLLLAAGLAAFRAQKPIGEVALVLSPNQVRDLITDQVSSTGGVQIGGVGSAMFNSMAVDGYRGPYMGMHLFESSNVAAADGANDVGGFVAVSPGPSSPSLSGLSLGVWSPIEAKGLYKPEFHADDVTVSTRCGFVRTAEYLVRGLISKKAA